MISSTIMFGAAFAVASFAIVSGGLWLINRSRHYTKPAHDFDNCPACGQDYLCAEGKKAIDDWNTHWYAPQPPKMVEDDPNLSFATSADRVPMRNRYTAPRDNVRRDMSMADQIVADQQVAHEKPGKEAHQPAPGEKGYQVPQSGISVSAGGFTVKCHRDGACWFTAPDGSTTRFVTGSDTSDCIASLALEVMILRDQVSTYQRITNLP